MISNAQEYIEAYKEYDNTSDENLLEEIRAYNKKLIESYPFLLPRNRFTGEVSEDYDYSCTELDDMPSGWRIAFGEQMCEEIANLLKKANYIDNYHIVQIKEKYGSLRWYDSGVPQKNYDAELYSITEKYEELSKKTCIICGKPAKWITKGWIMPICDECKNKEESFSDSIEINKEI